MSKQTLRTWLGFTLGLTISIAGCGTGGSSDGYSGAESTGSLQLSLELGGDAKIDEVWYNITGSEMAPMTGFIDTSAPGSTASVEVFGLLPGTGYLVELRAIVDDGTSCSGSAPFDVVAGVATSVAVMINCKPPERFGSVRVNGKLNVCAELMKAVVSPLQTSVGSTIDLSAQGFDAEGDPVSYLWSASGGPVGNPASQNTEYFCASPGQHFVQIQVSDDDFTDCIDTWTVPVICGDSDGGTGGSAGSGGTGGTAGTGGISGSVCMESNSMCSNASIDPIDETCAPALPTPSTADVCTGGESTENPVSCTATGTTVTHQLTQMQVLGDCNVGYNLDGCDGNSCVVGGLAPGEGIDGVDNALAGLAPILVGVGGNLGGLDQALYNSICDGSIDLGFRVDTNLEENCAIVELLVDGTATGSVLLNVSDPTDGAVCASGQLGAIPIDIAGVPGVMNNTLLRATISEAGFSNGTLGGTVDQATAAEIADALIEGGSAVVAQVFEINDNLSGDTSAGCNALSMTLTIGGVTEPQ